MFQQRLGRLGAFYGHPVHSSSPSFILSRIAAASPAQSQTHHLSSKIPISAENVSRALKNATDLRCTSLAGHNRSKITWLRWREPDWRSYRFGSPLQTSATQMHRVIWNIGAGFPSFSG